MNIFEKSLNRKEKTESAIKIEKKQIWIDKHGQRVKILDANEEMVFCQIVGVTVRSVEHRFKKSEFLEKFKLDAEK
ncbi:MAG: hypothetical protein PHD51_01515 [Patescibacteria group bacterium]|nr:hypothetical protein [Patescibacteria group bacterium]MDD5490460.1 hypothetical protein [Patescibacteria group bacterium]